jgi:hypothetical protein
VVHVGRKVSREEARFVLDTVHDWLAYLVSSVELELALRKLKRQVESKEVQVRDGHQAQNIVVEYFGREHAATTVFPSLATFEGVSLAPDIILEFGKYRVAVTAKFGTVRSLEAFSNRSLEDRQSHPGRYRLPEMFTHGAVVFFAKGKQRLQLPEVVWSDDRVVNVFIQC